MKKLTSIILLCLGVAAILAGCANQQAAPSVAIANPWSTWNSIQEAEAAVGCSFGLPEVIAGSYNATEFRTMNNKLIEVVYSDGDFQVCIRKETGENQDVSGDYNQYETCSEENRSGAAITTYFNSGNGAKKQLISHQGYSWSLVASNGYWGDSNEDFLQAIMET